MRRKRRAPSTLRRILPRRPGPSVAAVTSTSHTRTMPWNPPPPPPPQERNTLQNPLKRRFFSTIALISLPCMVLFSVVFLLLRLANHSRLAGQRTFDSLTPEKVSVPVNAPQEVAIDGEVFIVTKSGSSLKLGLVEAAVIPMPTLQPHLKEFHSILTNELASIDLSIMGARKEQNRLAQADTDALKHYCDVIKQNHDSRTVSEADGIRAKAHAAFNTAFANCQALYKQRNELLTGSLYFNSMPSPLRTTKTNSDGRFRIAVPGSGSFAVIATTQREVAEDVDHYYWIIRIDPKDGTNQTLMLSNDNLLSPARVDSLIEAP